MYLELFMRMSSQPGRWRRKGLLGAAAVAALLMGGCVRSASNHWAQVAPVLQGRASVSRVEGDEAPAARVAEVTAALQTDASISRVEGEL